MAKNVVRGKLLGRGKPRRKKAARRGDNDGILEVLCLWYERPAADN